MYAKLTEKPNHSFGLPVVGDLFESPIAVTGPNGTQHPASIFKIWPDLQLRLIGYARVKLSDVSENMTIDGYKDKMVSNVVVRTYSTMPKSTIPANKEDYKSARYHQIAETMGGGSYKEAVGNQLDAFLKWATTVRMQQSNVAKAIDGMTEINAASRTALKAALDPVFDLPADLDSVLAKWTAAKGKYPKPE